MCVAIRFFNSVYAPPSTQHPNVTSSCLLSPVQPSSPPLPSLSVPLQAAPPSPARARRAPRPRPSSSPLQPPCAPSQASALPDLPSLPPSCPPHVASGSAPWPVVAESPLALCVIAGICPSLPASIRPPLWGSRPAIGPPRCDWDS